MCGVYPDAGAKPAGEQISSTYEGRHVTLYASELTHAGAKVAKGRPVVFGRAVGIAFETEVLGTDLIAVDTEGIWSVSVLAEDDADDSAVVPGDRLYIHKTTCVVSKIQNMATQIPFGYALGEINAGDLNTIAVKVHQDPNELGTVYGAKTFAGAVSVGGTLNALEHFVVAYDATIRRDLSVLQHFSVAYNAIVGNDLTVRGHGNVAYNLIVGNDLTVSGHASGLRVHAGNGANFSGAITNLTVEDGIVTAAS